MDRARAILERELANYRRMLALEINKARWIEGGDLDRAMAAQDECDRVIAGMRTVPDLFAELPAGERPSPEAMRAHPRMRDLHDEVAAVIDKLIALSTRNQERVRRLMDQVSEGLRELDRNRRALRGYRSGSDSASQYVDGSL
jgi:hypothetical protein